MATYELDDPALKNACDVYASLDGNAWTFVGTALEPCTARLPFQLPVDPGLIGTVMKFKFAPIGTKKFGSAHSCTIRDEVLKIAASG